MIPFLNKKYQIIYADPPWNYKARVSHGTRVGQGACGHYQSMSFNDIKKLPVPDLTEDNCALFLWCTFPKIKQQIKLFDYWGFRYTTIGFIWVKTNIRNNKPFFGTGYYAKSNTEPCLLGIKGKLKPVSNSVSSVVIAPRREHSRKPDEVRNRIVELFGEKSRIELFAREQNDGWDTWGDESKSEKFEEVITGDELNSIKIEDLIFQDENSHLFHRK